MAGTRSLKVRPDSEAGKLLREARRSRKLSTAGAAAATKLSPDQIAALEAGDFSFFSAEVYGRGAYLAYARYLGIKERTAERVLERALSAARERVPLKVFTPFGWAQRFLTPLTMLWLVAALAGLTAAGYIIWQFQAFLRLPRLTLLEPAGSIVGTPELTVQGIAGANARVTVNGEAALLGEDGQFGMKLWLHPGVNVLRLEAENAAGRKTVVEKHLLLPRK